MGIARSEGSDPAGAPTPASWLASMRSSAGVFSKRSRFLTTKSQVSFTWRSPPICAVARQDSEFDAKAASGSGAKGLMQQMTATAQDTTRSAGLPFEAERLINAPAFNAQIGQFVNDEAGSALLAFAAYNPGSAQVQQWISAYGDPRHERRPRRSDRTNSNLRNTRLHSARERKCERVSLDLRGERSPGTKVARVGGIFRVSKAREIH